jgi:large subunit ribosomal protein L13
MGRKYQEQKTTIRKKADLKPNWFQLDASGKILGRFASEIAKILRGKHRPDFSPELDCGDGVVILNAEKVTLTGSKEAQKIYRYYTGHVGGLREIPFEVMKARKPEYIIRQAVSKMMPKTKLGRAQLKKLRIFSGEEHNLQSQKPIEVKF